MPRLDKKDKDMLMESLGICFAHSWTKQESVRYIRKKHGGIFKEDIINRGFDIMTKNKIRDPKYGEGKINIMSMVEKDMLMESLEFCVNHAFTKETAVTYVKKTHDGLFEEEMIKHMFDIVSKIKKRVPRYQGEAMVMSKKDVLFQSIGFCFSQYFTEDETVNYVAKCYGGLFEKSMIERVFDVMSRSTKNRDPSYEEGVASRSSFRKLLTQEHPWTTEEKWKVIDDRLSLLCQETKALLGDFTRIEKYILGFFITRFPDEVGDPHARGGIDHRMYFHCHCFHCYQRFFRIFECFSEEKKKVIDLVLNEFDVAEGNQEITLETEQEEEVKKEKPGGGKKTQSGKKKASGKKKSRK